MLFYVIFGYCKLFHFKLFATIIVTFGYSKLFHLRLFFYYVKLLLVTFGYILGYFLLCKVINYFTLHYFWQP
jgi:hypothetical protein